MGHAAPSVTARAPRAGSFPAGRGGTCQVPVVRDQILILAAFVSLAACGGDDSIHVRGRFLDKDGRPVANAVLFPGSTGLTVDSRLDVRTDEEGRYDIVVHRDESPQ